MKEWKKEYKDSSINKFSICSFKVVAITIDIVIWRNGFKGKKNARDITFQASRKQFTWDN